MRLFLFLLIAIIQFGCSDNCVLEERNKFLTITDSDLQHLDKINQLILQNVDTLIKASNNMSWQDPNEIDSLRSSIGKFHVTNQKALQSCLSKRDSIEFGKHYTAINKSFNFYRADFRPLDSTFDYEVKIDACDNPKQKMDIYHHLLFRTSPKNFEKYKSVDLVKEKQINQNWTYYIDNIPWYGR